MVSMDKRIKTGAIIGLGILLLVLFIIFQRNANRNGIAADDQTRVAAILNLTGPAARFDAIKQQTLEVAMERLHQQYPDLKISLRVLDAGGGPESTTVAVRRATGEGATCFLSGTSLTALGIAAQVRGREPPVAQLANAANPDFGPPRLGEYRFWPDWEHEAEVIAGILIREKIDNVLLIHSTDPYSEALTASLKRNVELADSVVLRQYPFDPAATPDFRPPLLRAKQDQARALVVFGLPPGLKALLSQLKEVAWDKPVIGGVNINLAVADFDAADLKCPLWLIETEAMREMLREDSEAYAYREAYQAKFGELPQFHALYLADALYFIAAAVSDEATANRPIVERLQAVSNFEGPSGEISVTPERTLRLKWRLGKSAS
jgi:ABC-type branched-subunit amino acid transport system substrate-binding protein